MKKAIIALAVAAGSIAVAQADTTTLYGQVGAEAKINFGNLSAEGNKPFESFKNGLQQSSLAKAKIGIKGEEDLGNGVSAFFKYEFGVDTNAGINETKKALVGFKGDFGSVTFGKQDNVFGDFTEKSDYYNNSQFKGFAFGDNGVSLRYDSAEFVDGLGFAAAINPSQEVLEAGVGFNAYGVDLGVAAQYNYTQGAYNPYRLGVSAEYTYDALSVAADYQFKPETAKKADDALHLLNLGAKYQITDASSVYGSMGFVANHFSAGQVYGLGYNYDISKRTNVWVEGGLAHKGESAKNAKDATNALQFNLGLKHKF